MGVKSECLLRMQEILKWSRRSTQFYGARVSFFEIRYFLYIAQAYNIVGQSRIC